MAILGCTATLIFAFLPLAALPGGPGKFIRVLPVTVLSAIVGSLLVALFIIPFIASRLLEESEDPHGNKLLQRVMGAIHRYYRPALHYCLARPKAHGAGGHRWVYCCCRPRSCPSIGSSLFPKADTPQFLVSIEAPNGTSLAETDAAVRFVEDKLAKMPEVRSWFANVGHGNPQIYYNHIVRKDAPNYGEIFVQLKKYDTRETPRALDALRAKLNRYPAARIYVKEFVNGLADQRTHRRARRWAAISTCSRSWPRRSKHCRSTPGTRDVQNPLNVSRTNLRLAVDSQKASLLGVSDRGVRSRRAALGGGCSLPARSRIERRAVRHRAFARRWARARTSMRSAKCAFRRSHGADAAALAAGDAGVRARADSDPALQPRARGRRSTPTSQRGFNTAKVTRGRGEAAGRGELAARLPLRAGRRGAVERGSVRGHRHGDHRGGVWHLRDPRARVRRLQIDADRADGGAAGCVRRRS